MGEPETFKLSDAAVVNVEIKIDGTMKTEKFDAYELLALITEGESDHGDDGGLARLYLLREAITKKFAIKIEEIAWNQILDLREAVTGLTNRLYDERKKKYSSTADSQVSIQDFPILSESGQTEKSEHGSITPLPSAVGEQT